MSPNYSPQVFFLISCFFLSSTVKPSSAQGTTKGSRSATYKTANLYGSSSFHVETCHAQIHSGLMVVLHGKGGHAQLTSLARQFKSAACARNLAIVAPAASSSNQNWPFEREGGDKQDLFLVEILKNGMDKRITLKKQSETVFVGISAGATFLMGDFYPRHAHRYRGAAIALCGGSWPTDKTKLKQKASLKKFPLAIRISSKDFLFKQSEAGIRAYETNGVSILKKITHEQGHCNFSLTEATNELLTELIPVSK